jgi:hypothetical protein
MKTLVVNKYYDSYDIYIGRGSKWGNPFQIGKNGTRYQVIEKFKKYAIENNLNIEAKLELKGKILGCYCKPKDCHGDILAEWANECD